MSENPGAAESNGGLPDGLFSKLPDPQVNLPRPADAAAAPGSRRARRAAAPEPVQQGRSDGVAIPPRPDVPPQQIIVPPKPTTPAAVAAGTPVATGQAADSPRTASAGAAVGAASTPAAETPASLEDLFTPEEATPLQRDVKKRKRRRGCLIGLIVFLLVLGGIAGGAVAVWNAYGDKISDVMGWGPPKDWEPGDASGETTVTIAAGDTGEPVSSALFDAGVTRTEGIFYEYLLKNNLNPTFFPGVYTLQEKMTAEAALSALEDPANRVQSSASVAEGAAVAAILPGIAESLGMPLADLEAATADPAAYGIDAQNLEGWLFPAVYTFDPGITASDVITTMIDRTRESLANAGVPAGDEQRVLTIASIIQREGREADFDKVSRVIQNRLDDGMMLQMDSTAQYGVGELHAGSVSTSEEAQFDDNPWNTYVIEGLPATPISTASDAAIAAAMSPAEGPWLYFVTVNPESGETVFTTNYNDHLAATEQWAQWCRDNGNPANGCSG